VLLAGASPLSVADGSHPEWEADRVAL
jgi:hypothetical protein